MENLKKLFYLFSLLLLLVVGFSCEKDDPIGGESSTTTNINNWILENMQTYYFWNEQIPSKTISKSSNPKDYFESLLYKTEDRFSWIQENYTDLLNLLSGIQMEAGYDYTLMRVSEGSQDIVGIINYIKPNSPASKTELRRGDLFRTINGTSLTISNYRELLNALSSPHTLGIVDRNLNPTKNIALSVTEYSENPVLLDTVYTISGKKIAYLVYNFFAEDSGDKTNTYIEELNNIFGKYKTTGIQELIVDLRYNGGGALSTCAELSSMISNRNGNELFGIMQYNKLLDDYFKKREGADYNKSYFKDKIGNTPINKLTNLNRLYVITSIGTASASEMLINCLKAYMDVTLIGGVTYGKNVGSITIYEEDTKKQLTNKWGMQPIVVKLANAKEFSDYGNGFNPDVNVENGEYAYYPLLPLGDINETLLQATLVKMGVMQAITSLRADKKNTFVPVWSSIDRTPVRRNMYLPQEKRIHE